MIEEQLLNYGSLGLFCVYLIYDKRVLMNKIIVVLEKLTERIEKCPRK